MTGAGHGGPGPAGSIALPRLVRIPRHLLHAGLDDLAGLGVREPARAALRALMADLPIVPGATLSAQLVGPPATTLPCLAVLARHLGQGLRDHNLALAHDRPRLRAERRKLLFLDGPALAEAVASGDPRPGREAVLCLAEPTSEAGDLLVARDAARLASFVATVAPIRRLSHWRTVDLAG